MEQASSGHVQLYIAAPYGPSEEELRSWLPMTSLGSLRPGFIHHPGLRMHNGEFHACLWARTDVVAFTITRDELNITEAP